MNEQQFIGIEGGGTKFVCSYGSSPSDLHERTVIDTQDPQQTIPELLKYIGSVRKKTPIDGIGAAIFGPLDLNLCSPTYGYITTTPKSAWANFDFVGALHQGCHLPVAFDTDVNGAAFGEYCWGAGMGLQDFIYLTVGTGIGGGVMINGKLVHGAMHPEMGHMLIPPDLTHDRFEGICNYHKHCLEGFASGPAIKARWNVKSALDLPPEHRAWDLEAEYLGIALANYTLTLSPQRIILGGGVMRQTHLIEKVRQEFLKQLNGYLKYPTYIDNVAEYIVSPALGENSGICGAIALAKQMFQEGNCQRQPLKLIRSRA
jgi:fructokinase